MLAWYLHLTLAQRATLWLLTIVFILVMAACFRGLLRSPWSWYRGVQSTPIFQVIMWIGALPLILPVVFLIYKRKKNLKEASFVGNIRSRIYHLPGCEWQKQISSNLFRYPFKTHAQAESAGFRACRVCKP